MLNIDVKDGLIKGVVGMFQEIEYRGSNERDAIRLWFQFTVSHTSRMACVKAKPLVQSACRRGITIKAAGCQ